MILDFIGGSFSLLQTIFDAVGRGKNPFSGGGFNIVKFMLSILAMSFDIIFLFQHYVLYRSAWVEDRRKKKEQLEEVLLGNNRCIEKKTFKHSFRQF